MIDMTSCAYPLFREQENNGRKNVSRTCCRMVSERFQPFYSHSGDITRMYYDGVYDIVTIRKNIHGMKFSGSFRDEHKCEDGAV